MAGEMTIRDIQRNKNRNQRLVRLILLPVGLVFLAGSLYSLSMYALSSLAGLQMVSAVNWEQTVSGPAWSFQKEYTAYTDQAGMLTPYVQEGDRVSKGLEVANLRFAGDAGASGTEAGSRRLYSPIAGIISFAPDGLEILREAKDYQELTIAALEEKVGAHGPSREEGQGLAAIIQEKVNQESREGDGERADAAGGPVQAAAGSAGQGAAAHSQTPPREVPAGSMIMKVTDNLSDCLVYMRLPMPGGRGEAPFYPTDPVRIKLVGEGEGKGTVLICEEISGGWGVLFKLDSGLEALRRDRLHQLILILRADERTAVPLGTVVMKDGATGIYISEKNKVRWKPVRVVGEKDGLQVIEGAEPGDISPGDLVVTRPWLIWDGMRLQG